MKWTKFAVLAAVMLTLTVGVARAASNDIDRDESCAGKMLNKLGRGAVNTLTCWVEVPRNIAIEWEKTDPATGFILGTVKGVGWGFARLVTGVYEVVTFPFPVPPNYQPLMEPEYVVTDIWGDPIPGVSEFSANDPNYPKDAPIYPGRYTY